jgi:hypothetical protein
MAQTQKTELKALTLENLRADDACSAGMEWITPLIEANDPELVNKLIEHERGWWYWAAQNGYEVYSTLSNDLKEKHNVCRSSSNSGDYGSSSNSGYGGSSSNSGVGGSSSNSGVGGSSSNSGYRGSSSNSGDYGSSSNSGNYGSSSNSGVGGIAAGFGTNSEVSGSENSCLCCTWWDAESGRPRLKVGYVGEDLKPNVWYTVSTFGEWVEGKAVEVPE